VGQKVLIKLSHSALNDFSTCPRKFYFSSIHRIKTKRFIEALGLGSLFHECVAMLYKTSDLDVAIEHVKKEEKRIELTFSWINKQKDYDSLEYSSTVVQAALHAWYKKFYVSDMHNGLKVIELEKKYSGLKIINPSTGKTKRNFRWSFIADMVAEVEGELWLVEYKTTRTVNEDYFERLSIDTQISGYIYQLQKIYNRPIKGVIYRVLKKPSIRLKKTESRAHYIERVKELFQEKPNEFLIEKKIYRTNEEISEFEIERWEKIQHVAFINKRGVYPKNTNSCTGSRKCEYFTLCTKKEGAEKYYERK
tara:strand:+ start:456 stop:1376 length:921 start_codon:yes stop_codon:yes gene_type:complete